MELVTAPFFESGTDVGLTDIYFWWSDDAECFLDFITFFYKQTNKMRRACRKMKVFQQTQ